MAYALERLKEASTWRGIIMLATGFGINIAPDLMNSIIAVGVSVAGMVGVFTKD